MDRTGRASRTTTCPSCSAASRSCTSSRIRSPGKRARRLAARVARARAVRADTLGDARHARSVWHTEADDEGALDRDTVANWCKILAVFLAELLHA